MLITTHDLTTIATLIYFKYEPERVAIDPTNPKRKIFYFNSNEKINAIQAKLRDGSLRVEPADFLQAVKRAKIQMASVE